MRFRASTMAALLVVATACSEQPTETEMTTGGANTGAPASAAGPDTERRLTQLAECSSTMKAVGNLYRSIASQETGEQAEQMLQSASARTAAGDRLRAMAVELAPTLGRTAADVDRIIAASDAEIQQASETMPFEQFATQAAREGDQCAPLLGGGS